MVSLAFSPHSYVFSFFSKMPVAIHAEQLQLFL